ncbi:MAG: electron transfer flavoprotein subunit alpha [Verrucomicrobiae bacterium]|nr:electron transfer flavoprotein subunit alpha [Verrucomicrobiae bacterium]
MEKILVLAHVEADGSLSRPSLEAIGAAKQLGSTFSLGLIGSGVEGAANQVGGCGAQKVFAVSGTEFAQPRYATDAAAAEAVIRAAEATVIIVPHTSRWGRVVAGVAARVDGRADTHVTAIAAGGPSVTRWYYRQRIEVQLTRTQRPWLIALEPGCVPPVECVAGTVSILPVTVNCSTRTEVVGVKVPEASHQTIRPDAKLLFVAGAGWTKKQPDGQTHVEEAAEIILRFLNATQASLGSTKSLVELRSEGQSVLPFMSHLNQIGQTGSTPRHPKGLATCCHGEEPHTIGWRFITERRAINLDPNCGWARGKADVLYVADAFAVMRKVNELLMAAREAQATDAKGQGRFCPALEGSA